MAEEGEKLVEYELVTDKGEKKNTSVEYSGKGKATYPNGDVYEGEFVNGLRHGPGGTYTYAGDSKAAPPDGGEEGAPAVTKEVYVGEWKDNLKHGIGKQNYIGQGEYTGYWEKGEKHGEGVMKYLNGDIYSGQWANGNKEGQGTYIFDKTASKFIGTFKAGQIVSGKWLYPNGSYFHGNFENNQPKGKGQWHF